MQLKLLISTFVIPIFVIPVLAIGRQCCCDRYSQFGLTNAEGVVAHCKSLWADVAAGRSGEDYCESGYCIQQQSWVNIPNAGKCVVAGYQCGDCANGNVGCLG
ncbi:hypothetical protein B0O99DRAFT_598557 [Bisporella sp. PMI_857]|nr:hypothetical protein B0O99DRAFT_598557 [Bisporella sp. PMI_857]